MDILIEKGIKTKDINLPQISENLRRFNINTKYRWFEFNGSPTINEISECLEKSVFKKSLLLTKRKIKGKELGFEFRFHGVSNEVDGNVGLIEVKKGNKKNLSIVLLHEILHLKGLEHCNKEKCLMSAKYYDIEREIQLCDSCERKLHGR